MPFFKWKYIWVGSFTSYFGEEKGRVDMGGLHSLWFYCLKYFQIQQPNFHLRHGNIKEWEKTVYTIKKKYFIYNSLDV